MIYLFKVFVGNSKLDSWGDRYYLEKDSKFIGWDIVRDNFGIYRSSGERTSWVRIR